MLPNHTTFSVVSRRFGMLAVAGAFAMLLGLSTGCNSTPKGPLKVNLAFRPAHAEPIGGQFTETGKVFVAPVNDKRKDKDQIGQNLEESTPVPVYAADAAAPGEFIRGVLTDELRKFGADVVDSAAAADRVINIDLNKFWVEETGTYKAELSAMVNVTDKSGANRWKGVMEGAGTDFGRSLSAENYNGVLSDATRKAVGSVLTNPQFQKALAR